MSKESHQFYCTECGKEGMPVVRTGKGKCREKGHLKKLWCLNCKKETNHAEITTFYTVDMFNYEFTSGNFVEGERVNSVDSMIKKYNKEN